MILAFGNIARSGSVSPQPLVCEDEVGNEARCRERARRHEDLFRSPAFGVKSARKWMGCGNVDGRHVVPMDRYAVHCLRALRADGGELE